jgi:predicted phosphodiesterase
LQVAALYDVHGNLPALDAVLAEVDADVVLVGGDIAAGPWPAETLARLRGLGGDVRFIGGNADREVTQQTAGLAPRS